MSEQISTPIAFIVFNRPHLAKIVFSRITEAKPKKLYLISDGARENRPGEKEKVEECRNLLKNIDWPCEVVKIFAEKNLGCKMRISSGLNEVFNREEAAIILEDDCHPDISFFSYCQELLHKYRDNEKIMMIAGGNIAQKSFTEDSYFFAPFGGVWGWATWRRAWIKYDVKMSHFSYDERLLRLKNPEERKQRFRMWRDVFEGKIDTWDVQWDFMMYRENALAAVPAKNMIKNLGFGQDATHTQNLNDPNSKLVALKTSFPLKHPAQMQIDQEYAMFYGKFNFRKNIWIDLKKTIKRILGK